MAHRPKAPTDGTSLPTNHPWRYILYIGDARQNGRDATGAAGTSRRERSQEGDVRRHNESTNKLSTDKSRFEAERYWTQSGFEL
jgi:hypothetical protein